MLGVTQGPITGKLVAEWIGEGKTSLDLTALRPERFRRAGRNSNESGITDAA